MHYQIDPQKWVSKSQGQRDKYMKTFIEKRQPKTSGIISSDGSLEIKNNLI